MNVKLGQKEKKLEFCSSFTFSLFLCSNRSVAYIISDWTFPNMYFLFLLSMLCFIYVSHRNFILSSLLYIFCYVFLVCLKHLQMVGTVVVVVSTNDASLKLTAFLLHQSTSFFFQFFSICLHCRAYSVMLWPSVSLRIFWKYILHDAVRFSRYFTICEHCIY